MNRREPTPIAQVTPEWAALIKHLAGCPECQASQRCDEGERLKREHKAAQR